MNNENKGVPSPDGERPSEVHEEHDPPGGPGALDPLHAESPSRAESAAVITQTGGRLSPPPPPTTIEDGEDEGYEEEQGMVRMSLMAHLEELRSRIIKALWALALAFIFSLVFAGKLWDIIREPAVSALKHLGVNPPQLAQHTPMESFSIIWVQLPLLCSVFIASPWIVYQLWAFISPGLYKKERRWAMPFVLVTAGLFIGGGLFAYFLAFRYGLEFLLGIGINNGVTLVVSITDYFDLFVNVTLGVGLVFELPVLIFLLTLLRILSPRFLLRHSRYAILAIVIIATIVTPTPDAFNLMLFAVPMCALYFVGIFFSYLLVLKREGKRFPWTSAILISIGILLIVAAIGWAFIHYHWHFIEHWPYLTQ